MPRKKSLIPHIEKWQADYIGKLSNAQRSRAATVQSLLAPFIRVLEYDPENLDDFEMWKDLGMEGEFSAIIKDGKPAVLIGCVSAGTPLSPDGVAKLRRGMNKADVLFGIFTDGRHYRFYLDMAESWNIEFTPFMEIDMFNGVTEEIITSIKPFRRSEFSVDSALIFAERMQFMSPVKKVFEDLWGNSEGCIDEILGKICDGRTPKVDRTRLRTIIRDAFSEFIGYTSPLQETESLENAQGVGLPDFNLENYKARYAAKPSQILFCFKNGSQEKLANWKDLLKRILDILLQEGTLTVHKLPIQSHPRRYIVHTVPLHPDGKRFNAPFPIANSQMYVETNLSAQGVISSCIAILKECGENPDTFVSLHFSSAVFALPDQPQFPSYTRGEFNPDTKDAHISDTSA